MVINMYDSLSMQVMESGIEVIASSSTEVPKSTSEEHIDDTSNIENLDSIQEEILVELKVTNNLLGVSVALNFFAITILLVTFIKRIIRNNVTKYL